MISLHFSVLVSLFEFVPLELIVELDVSDDPKCQDQISDRLFYGRWSLRKVSRYDKSSIKPPGGLFISRRGEQQGRERGGGASSFRTGHVTT